MMGYAAGDLLHKVQELTKLAANWAAVFVHFIIHMAKINQGDIK